MDDLDRIISVALHSMKVPEYEHEILPYLVQAMFLSMSWDARQQLKQMLAPLEVDLLRKLLGCQEGTEPNW